MFRNVVLRFYGLEFRPQPWPVPRTCPAISAKKSVLGTYACPARISSSIDIAGHDTVQQIAVYHVLTSRTSHSSATSFSPHIQRLYRHQHTWLAECNVEVRPFSTSSNVCTHIALLLCACVCFQNLHLGLRADEFSAGSNACLASARMDRCLVHAVVRATSQVSTSLHVSRLGVFELIVAMPSLS